MTPMTPVTEVRAHSIRPRFAPSYALTLAVVAALVACALLAAGPAAGSAAAQEKPSKANAPAAPGGEVAPGKSPGDAANNLRNPNGGGGEAGGWDPLISTLQTLVPIAGALGLLVGLAIWGSAGPNSVQKATGLGVMGTAFAGLLIGSFAADLAALFTQFI